MSIYQNPQLVPGLNALAKALKQPGRIPLSQRVTRPTRPEKPVKSEPSKPVTEVLLGSWRFHENETGDLCATHLNGRTVIVATKEGPNNG